MNLAPANAVLQPRRNMMNERIAPVRCKRLIDGCLGYRPIRMATPAARARTAMTVPRPEKPRCSNGISPVRTSQMPKSSIPMLFVIFTWNSLEGFFGSRLTSSRLRIRSRILKRRLQCNAEPGVLQSACYCRCDTRLETRSTGTAVEIGRSRYPVENCTRRGLSNHRDRPDPSWSSGLLTPRPPGFSTCV